MEKVTTAQGGLGFLVGFYAERVAIWIVRCAVLRARCDFSRGSKV